MDRQDLAAQPTRAGDVTTLEVIWNTADLNQLATSVALEFGFLAEGVEKGTHLL